jgi:hypothetical protein
MQQNKKQKGDKVQAEKETKDQNQGKEMPMVKIKVIYKEKNLVNKELRCKSCCSIKKR